MNSHRILAIDIGSGTQDILLWDPDMTPENCPKMILPSPTTIIARNIQEATANGLDLFLTGKTMGGGPCTRAIKNHLRAGYRVFSLHQPALTFNDDLDKVQAMGVQLVDKRPGLGSIMEIPMADLDMDSITEVLRKFQIPLPDSVAVAVQDHGYSPKESNRAVRFKQWQRLLKSGIRLEEMVFQNPPGHLTRMKAVVDTVPGTWVMDTGVSAILGAMKDPWVSARIDKGMVVVNIGNEHILAALVKGRKVWGIYEHHTSLMDPSKLSEHLNRFRKGELSNHEIWEEHGHGCETLDKVQDVGPFPYTTITGPRRKDFMPLEGHWAAPFGDMMLTGCFGLVEAVTWKLSQK